MKSPSIHRSETHKEVQDQYHLANLIRTRSRVARLKQLVPAPLNIPHHQHQPHMQSNAPSQTHLVREYLVSSSIAHPAITATTAINDNNDSAFSLNTYVAQHSHTAQAPPASLSLPSTLQPYTTVSYDDHPGLLLAPSRSSTPTPYMAEISRVPTPTPPMLKLRKLLDSTSPSPWHASAETLLDVNVHDDSNLSTSVSENDTYHSTESNRRASAYIPAHAHHRSYDYGIPVHPRTGAMLDDGGNHASESLTRHKGGGGSGSSGGRSPQALQDPEQAYQNKLLGGIRQDQMLKRSSQLYPLHNSHSRLGNGAGEGGEGLGQPWPQQWRLSKKNSRYIKRVSDITLVSSDSTASMIMTEQEKTKLQELFEKKRLLNGHAHGIDMSARIDGSLDLPPEAPCEPADGETIYGIDEYERQSGQDIVKDWTDRAGCNIPLGLLVVLICTFMIVYDGALSAIVFQASRFPSDANLPVFIFSITYMVGVLVSLIGLVVTMPLLRARLSPKTTVASSTAPSSRQIVAYRLFHLAFLTISFTNYTSMMTWLGVNVNQTGSLSRLYIPPLDAVDENGFLTLESMLKPDPLVPNTWEIYPWLWILVFTLIFLVQLYFWLCLVAFARRASAQLKRIERWKDERVERSYMRAHEYFEK